MIGKEDKQYTFPMRDTQPAHYFGIDIGTSTVRCVVGTVNQENPSDISIIGYGEASNTGMRKGNIVHAEDVVEAVVNAVTEAEKLSGVHIERATININGSHINGMNSHGVVAISATNREITLEDCLRVEEAASTMQLPPNREIVQVFAKNYSLDGQENIKDPVGMHGVRLEVETHIITALTPSLRNLYQVLEKTNIAINHMTVSGLAGAEAVLNRQQKESGAMVLDIGSSTTNIAVIEDGEIQHVAVIPVGGINITNDLAIGLKTDLDIAEKVKIKHATLNETPQFKDVKVKHEGKEYTFSDSDVHMIIEARLEELLEYVDNELDKINRSKKLPGGVVIVGGTANLPGIDVFTREKLQLPARIGKLHKLSGLTENVSDPSYITSVGLMILDVLLGDAEFSNAPKQQGDKFNILKSTNKLFKRLKT